jgi:hypothetical protein
MVFVRLRIQYFLPGGLPHCIGHVRRRTLSACGAAAGGVRYWMGRMHEFRAIYQYSNSILVNTVKLRPMQSTVFCCVKVKNTKRSP